MQYVSELELFIKPRHHYEQEHVTLCPTCLIVLVFLGAPKPDLPIGDNLNDTFLSFDGVLGGVGVTSRGSRVLRLLSPLLSLNLGCLLDVVSDPCYITSSSEELSSGGNCIIGQVTYLECLVA